MNLSRQRILLILSVLGALVLLGMIWFFLFRSSPELQVGGGDPFGGIAGGDNPNEFVPDVLGDGIDYAGEAGTEVAPRLFRITDAPTSFGTLTMYIPEVPAATSTDGTIIPRVPPDIEVRFVERQSGNVYAYRVYARTLTRISNQTIPGVHEVTWLANGSIAYLRFLSNTSSAETLETYALPVGEGGGYYLEAGISEMVATSSSAILTLRTSPTGAVATIAAPDGSNPETAFSSQISDFAVAFLGRNYLATTRPSASVDGYGFLVSDATGAWTRVLGPLRGLTTLAGPTGASIVYSFTDRGTLSLNVLDVASRVSTALPLATHAEKCIFTRDGNTLYCAVPRAVAGEQPDEWYQGAIAFTDRIWKVDLQSRTAALLTDPSETADTAIDAVALSLDPTGDILTFVNRRDGSLWAYDL